MGPKKHVNTHDDENHTHQSYDIEDSGIRGIGSNWVRITNPHTTNQKVPKEDKEERYKEPPPTSRDIYADD